MCACAVGLPEGDGRQAQGRAVSQTVFTSLEAASMGIRNRDATQATQAVQRALGKQPHTEAELYKCSNRVGCSLVLPLWVFASCLSLCVQMG